MNGYCLRLAAWLGFGLGLCGWGQPPGTAVVPGGTGTEADPYRISELGHLAWMSNTAADSAGRYYTLSNDIDATATKDWDNGAGFTPIGTGNAPFAGVFNGNGHVIRNLTINRPREDNVGLFGVLSCGGELSNLGMEGGNVTGAESVGHLVGYKQSGTIIQCHATSTVTGSRFVGGLVGYNDGGTVTQCYATSAVTGSMTSCYGYAGGLVGYNNDRISQCCATGDVTGYERIGGLAGYNEGTIIQCYATGTATGKEDVGGLVGRNYDTITQCYATGAVISYEYNAGGLVGYSDTDTVSQSYWNFETTGQNESWGGTSMDTAAMKQAATFAGWDWSVWGIASDGTSYPYLRWDPPPFRVQAFAAGPGTVTATPSPDGLTVALTATANENAEFVRWEGFGITNRNSATTMVTADTHKTVHALFRSARAITCIEELQLIGRDPTYTINGRYWLTQDLDAAETAAWNAGAGFAPIGTEATPFTGVFNGNEHVIRNLVINRPQENAVGLFGTLGESGELRNLGMEGGEMTSCGHVGSLVGTNNGTVCQCYTTGIVTGYRDYKYFSTSVGGLVGHNSAMVTQCYAAITVTSDGYYTGGLVGYNTGTLTQCYATGTVTGPSSYSGGLVGYNSGTVNQCYAMSTLTDNGYGNVGGLVGIDRDGILNQSYWDTETTGQAVSSGGGTGMGTADMKQAATFAGWDWSVWRIAENIGYPYLQALPTCTLNYAAGANGTVSCMLPQIVNSGVSGSAVTAVANPNFHFVGWSDGSTQNPRTDTNVTANVSVTAQFSTNTYTLSLDAEEGLVSPANVNVTLGKVYGTLPVPMRSGYTFAGWWTGSNGTGARVDAAMIVTITTAHTLYANWTANACTVTFDAQGGLITPASKRVTFGAAYETLPIPTRSGYTFAGWWTGSNGTGTEVNATTLVTVAEDQTLHARWTAAPPVVATTARIMIGSTTATIGGQVTSDGAAVTARGVCWSTTPMPTVADARTTDGAGTGTFTSTLSKLSAETTYYVRAYATNSAGTAYGEPCMFTTSAASGPDFVITKLLLMPALPTANGKLTVTITVLNQGAGNGKAGTLQVWLDKPATAGAGETGNHSAAISTLKPGQSKTVKLTLTAPPERGAFTLRALIDAKNITKEDDEYNNQATLSYRTGRPDFTIKSVSLSPASPAAGKTFTAYVTVANAGEVAGNAGTLDAWADRSTLAAPPVPGSKTKGNKSKTLGTLQPGQEKTVTITGLKAAAATATPVLGLLLDSRAKTPETDEGNNWLDFEYHCQ